jgi:polysaccharide chain length determinant protein (PEP-CTERM system associated)
MDEWNETEKPFDLRFYLEKARRRKWRIIIPLLCSLVISLAVYHLLPKVYRASTLILVQPQTVPENYVQSTIRATVTDRLNTISQEILNRTLLERVITEFNLYPNLRGRIPQEEIVDSMSKAIEVSLMRGGGRYTQDNQNTFTISYEGEDPGTVMLVTNKLAALFIGENLKAREKQAESTSQFLTKELGRLEGQLVRKENDLRRFREQNMGRLPQQLEANLKILERLQMQLKTTSEGIRAAEDRSILLQNQLDQLKKSRDQVLPAESPKDPVEDDSHLREKVPEDPNVALLSSLKRDLSAAQARYTARHPDILELRKKIAELEPTVKAAMERQEAEKQEKAGMVRRENARRAGNRPPARPVLDPANERVYSQYQEQNGAAILEAKRLREEEKSLKEQLEAFQRRIEDTPKREQELLLLTRDYDLLKTNYQSLMEKKMQSQMSENLEKKQQGEQFKILDTARLPEKPVKPDLKKILLLGAFLGLFSGLALAWVSETIDTSFYTAEALEKYLQIPVVAEIGDMNRERRLITKG